MQSHPYCTICFKLAHKVFCKRNYKVQMDEQVYMTLQTVKQRPSGVNEEILGMNFWILLIASSIRWMRKTYYIASFWHKLYIYFRNAGFFWISLLFKEKKFMWRKNEEFVGIFQECFYCSKLNLQNEINLLAHTCAEILFFIITSLLLKYINKFF